MTPVNPETDSSSPSMYSQHQASEQTPLTSHELDDFIGTFSSLCTMSTPAAKRHPVNTQSYMRARAGILAGTEGEVEEVTASVTDHVASSQTLRKGIKCSYSVSSDETSATNDEVKGRRSRNNIASIHGTLSHSQEIGQVSINGEIAHLEEAIGSLSLSLKDEKETLLGSTVPSLRLPTPSKTQDHKFRGSPSKELKHKGHNSSKASASFQSFAVDTKGIDALPRQPSEHISVPPSRSSSPSKVSEKSKGKSRECTKQKGQEPEQTPSIGHLENLTISNGFWMIDSLAQSEDDSTTTKVDGVKRGQKKSDNKKRVPRVSILDLV
ncbi:XPG N-terminal [Penicillium atrosanguineum]|nr:XPG N-terminal [Penicillium atrosanguineum]